MQKKTLVATNPATYKASCADDQEVIRALIEALEVCEIDFAGDVVTGDDPHSNAVAAVRNMLAVVRIPFHA